METNNSNETTKRKKSVSEVMFDCGLLMMILSWAVAIVDAAVEKHVPVYEKDGNEIIVKVGEVEHPMTSEHYIMWVALIKDDMIVKVSLHPETIPEVRLPYVSGSEIYAYCNLHGLWKNIVE